MMRLFKSKEQFFLDAAENGNLDRVKKYIKRGGNMEEKDNDGNTVLHLASKYGHLDVVQYLIEKCQFDKEAKGRDDYTALHLASWFGHFEIVQYLIETCNVNKEAKDNDGWNALHYASGYGHLNIVHYLIETCHVDKDAKCDLGMTALHGAIRGGHLDIVQYLLETCLVDPEVKDGDGFSPLSCAIIHGQLNIVQYLVETCHFDIEAKHINGATACDLAEEFGWSSVVQYLEKARADSTAMNATNTPVGKTSADQTKDLITTKRIQREREFLDSAKSGDLDIIKELINNGVDKEAKDNNGRSVLHIASYNGHLKMVQYLLETCRVNKEAKQNDGWTALHYATYNGHLEIVQYLLETCRVNKEAKTNSGLIALHCASINGHLNVVQYLIGTCHVNMEVKANNGWTSLHCASDNGYLAVVRYLIETCHVDKEATDSDGKTAYDVAQEKSRSKVVQYLEKARAESTAQKANIEIGSTDLFIQSSDSNASSQTYELNENWLLKLQDETLQLIDKLNELDTSVQFIDERRDILDLVCIEKCHTLEEQNEQSAILASPLHRDFYLLLQRKLKCMIKSCETLSTGMVGAGGGDFRSFAAHTIREKGCNVLRETKLGYFIGNAVKWAQQNLAVIPFIDSVGSVFRLIVTLKAEHDRYLGLARVADFATMVCLQQYGTSSLDNAVEKLARWIVRARCGTPSCQFVEEIDEFGKYKQLMINLLADSGDTPAKEQASKAADCAFAHIMKPDEGSILFDVMHGKTIDAGLDEALAASVLGITLRDLRELDSFTMPSQGAIPSNADTNNRSRQVTTNTPNFGLNGASLHADSFASSELFAEHEAKIQEQNDMIQKLSYQVAHLEKKIKHSNSRTNYDAGDGLLHANPTEQFKNEIASLHTDNVMLDQRLRDQAIVIDSNESRIVDLEKQLSRLLPVIDTKGGTKKGANRNRNT